MGVDVFVLGVLVVVVACLPLKKFTTDVHQLPMVVVTPGLLLGRLVGELLAVVVALVVEAGLINLECTIKRFQLVPGGEQVINVISASLVGSSTATSVGSTTSVLVTWYT